MNHHHHHTHYTHPWPFLREIEKLGDEYLIRQAPWQLPHAWKEAITKVLPILVLVVAILSLPGIIGSLFFLLGFTGWGAGAVGSMYVIILLQTAITLMIAILYFKSFDRLRKRQYAGWVYVFYAGLLGFVSHLVNGGFWEIVGGMLGLIVTMYLLFQAKELYHS